MESKKSSSPFTIPEIAQILCSFIDEKDLLNVALSCRVFYYASIGRLWHTLQPQSYTSLRKIKNTLDGKSKYYKTQLDPQYHYLVKEFKCQLKDSINIPYISSTSSLSSSSSTTTTTIERPFFDSFLFPRLNKLIFSYAAAQDNSIAPILKATNHLTYIDLSHCYCLSTGAIQPLLDLPTSTLETVILYGCGKIESSALITLIKRHYQTLSCLKLTDITDDVLNAIQSCYKLKDLGLEHCSDESLTFSAITNFTNHLSISSEKDSLLPTTTTTTAYSSSSLALTSSSAFSLSSSSALSTIFTTASTSSLHNNNNKNNNQSHIQLNKLRLRDISNFKSEHLKAIATSSNKSLIHLDMSECSRITSEGLIETAQQCPFLETVCLAYQAGVTNQVIQTFAQQCQSLKKLDITGNYSLTDACFLYKPMHLNFLNISGLETQFSNQLIYQLLLHLPQLHELCLGVAFDLSEALSILNQVNTHVQINDRDHVLYDMNIEKYHTICRR